MKQENKPPIYQRRCRHRATAFVAKLRQSPKSSTCGLVAELRQLGTDPVARRAIYVEFVECFRGGQASVDEQLDLECERWQAGQREGFQLDRSRPLTPHPTGHARADEQHEVRPNRFSVVAAAERLPADMLAGRVVLQRPQSTAARNRTGRTPLSVPLPPPTKGGRPVIGGAVHGIREAKTASHRLTHAPHRGVGGAGSFLAEGPVPPHFGWGAKGRYDAAGRSGSFTRGLRRYQRTRWLMTLARSSPAASAAASKSPQSSSLMRTERCLVFGWSGTWSSMSGVRTVFNVTPLRCTYTDDSVVYVHRQANGGSDA